MNGRRIVVSIRRETNGFSINDCRLRARPCCCRRWPWRRPASARTTSLVCGYHCASNLNGAACAQTPDGLCASTPSQVVCWDPPPDVRWLMSTRDDLPPPKCVTSDQRRRLRLRLRADRRPRGLRRHADGKMRDAIRRAALLRSGARGALGDGGARPAAAGELRAHARQSRLRLRVRRSTLKHVKCAQTPVGAVQSQHGCGGLHRSADGGATADDDVERALEDRRTDADVVDARLVRQALRQIDVGARRALDRLGPLRDVIARLDVLEGQPEQPDSHRRRRRRDRVTPRPSRSALPACPASAPDCCSAQAVVASRREGMSHASRSSLAPGRSARTARTSATSATGDDIGRVVRSTRRAASRRHHEHLGVGRVVGRHRGAVERDPRAVGRQRRVVVVAAARDERVVLAAERRAA